MDFHWSVLLNTRGIFFTTYDSTVVLVIVVVVGLFLLRGVQGAGTLLATLAEGAIVTGAVGKSTLLIRMNSLVGLRIKNRE